MESATKVDLNVRGVVLAKGDTKEREETLGRVLSSTSGDGMLRYALQYKGLCPEIAALVSAKHGHPFCRCVRLSRTSG